MPVDDPTKIDAIATDRATGGVVLTIFDAWDWGDERGHLRALQAKINCYLDFIQSGQLREERPTADGKPLVMLIVTKYEPSPAGEELLRRASAVVAPLNLTIRQTRLPDDAPAGSDDSAAQRRSTVGARRSKGFKIAGGLFAIAGLIAALGSHAQVAAANVAVGMMFIVRRERAGEDRVANARCEVALRRGSPRRGMHPSTPTDRAAAVSAAAVRERWKRGDGPQRTGSREGRGARPGSGRRTGPATAPSDRDERPTPR